MSSMSLVAMFVCLLAQHAPLPRAEGPAVEGKGGGGAIGRHGPGDECITPAQRSEIERRITQNEAVLGSVPVPEGVLPPPPQLKFFPHGATLFQDAFTNNFVDLSSAAGAFSDFACQNWTYDGHTGTDSCLRSFGEQDIGVPVFAALDGQVIDRADGNTDHNIAFGGLPANYVVLRHSDNSQTWYYHLRNGSVSPVVGQWVRAGQQIGLTGSSGNSNVPHLHFEVRDAVGQVFEPWSGACRTGASGFVTQPTVVRTLYANDMGFWYQSISGLPATQKPPYAFPRTGYKASSGENTLYVWMMLQNVPANATWQFVFKRPNGTTDFTSSAIALSNGATAQRTQWESAFFTIPNLNTTTFLGTWRVSITLTSASTGTVTLVTDAPLTLVSGARTVANTPNRAPNAITVTLDPAAPTATDAVMARIGSSLTLDDPDYDIVKYRYVWKRNNTVIRDITHAGRADAIPAGSLFKNDVVRCDATAIDPSAAASPTVFVQATITVGPCPADIGSEGNPDPLSGPDGFVTGSDADLFIQAYFLELRNAAGVLLADLTDGSGQGSPDGFVTGVDFDRFVQAFFQGC